jgi:hypothetical protein
MALGHKDSRRPGRRAFQPTVDGRLETRVLLSNAAQIRSQTAAGGQAVVVTTPTHQQFFVSVEGATIRAFPAPGGRVSFVVDGSTADTLLEINQIIPRHSTKSGAHDFNPNFAVQGAPLNVASIMVTSGSIGSIEGYHDAVLSGPISVGGTTPVNRIAFQSILPGGSIGVGGTLNTLDVLNDAHFSKSTGLFVGQDLNWFEVGGNLTFESNANMTVGRDLGLTLQAPKGSGLGGQGLFVNGNFTIGATSHVTIGRNIPFGVVINGNFTGASRFTVGGLTLGDFFTARGGQNFAINGIVTA